MKFRTCLLFLLIVAFFGCHKTDTETAVAGNDVVFSITKTILPGEVLDNRYPFPDYARIVIDDKEYKLAVCGEGEKYLTVPLRLAAGKHMVSFLMLLNENGTPEDTEDDIVVMATPAQGSVLVNYVSKPTSFDFSIDISAVQSVNVEVLGYNELKKKEFGITFLFTRIVIREQCFFGDICVSNLSAYSGSLYEEQKNGLKVDLPAIFYVDVTHNGKPVTNSPFSNKSWLGEGKPLCVQYPDNLNEAGEVFTFDLYILMPDGKGGSGYLHSYSWTVTDSGRITSGNDGVVDFVLGDCVYTLSDFIITPPSPPGQYRWETAFAYSGNEYGCFLNNGFDRWGWVIGPVYQKDNLDAFFDLYAAAGTCSLDAGIKVGKVHLKYSQESVTVTYLLDKPYILSEVHLYIGNRMFPVLENGTSTVAPGSYGNTECFSPGEAVRYYQKIINVPNPKAGFYIIAHAVVGLP